MNCDSFFVFLRKYIPVCGELENRIREVAEFKTYPARTLLLEKGQVCRYFRYIVKGALRTYTYFEGREITTWFELGDYLANPFDSFFLQKPGFEYMETLEETLLLEIPHADYQQLYHDFPEMERFGRLWLEQESAFQVEFFKYYNYLSAAQKFDRLLTYAPDIDQRVKQVHIASFLGIAPETLSRIRANRLKE
jgi:CRP-like cAMP-binding protein